MCETDYPEDRDGANRETAGLHLTSLEPDREFIDFLISRQKAEQAPSLPG